MVTCPMCGSRSVRRSTRRNLRERLWSFAGRYPYRCYECQTRFYAFRQPKSEQTKKSPADHDQAPSRESR